MSEKIYFNSQINPEFKVFSNFYVKSTLIEKQIYQTNEHWFQCGKTTCRADHDRIRNAVTAKIAKELGKIVTIREDWEQIKDERMRTGLRYKFSDPNLREILLSTEGFELVEFAPWGDTYWGVDKNYGGQNKLGKMLMQLREELKGRS